MLAVLARTFRVSSAVTSGAAEIGRFAICPCVPFTASGLRMDRWIGGLGVSRQSRSSPMSPTPPCRCIRPSDSL